MVKFNIINLIYLQNKINFLGHVVWEEWLSLADVKFQWEISCGKDVQRDLNNLLI